LGPPIKGDDMKVIFLFMSKSSAAPGSTTTNDWLGKKAGKEYDRHNDESYFMMFKDLLDAGIISDLKVFFESGVHPGWANFVPGAHNYVIPEIRFINQCIDDDTVIFVRGGFKHWHDLLKERKGKNWLITYAANTGRDKWTWWDVVFDDLEMKNQIDRHERYHFPFIKPVNEEIFAPMASTKKYDICIGASHIHDKKGQYLGVKLMKEFKALYGYYPTAIMPGSLRRSLHTAQMIKDPILSNEVELPGMLNKRELARVFSESKVFLHLGGGGQGDRSVLEAHACGIPVVIKTPKRHSPLLKDDGQSIYHFPEGESMITWAIRLSAILTDHKPESVYHLYSIYQKRMGYENIIKPQLAKFFQTIAGTKPTLEMKEKLVKEITATMEVLHGTRTD